jgi:hypothetical protein
MRRLRPRICIACLKNDQTGERDKNGGSKASQHALSMPDALFEIEVPHWLLGRLVFGLLEGLLEFAIEDVFLLAFGFPGIPELVFAFARLFRQDARGVIDINVGRGFWRR